MPEYLFNDSDANAKRDADEFQYRTQLDELIGLRAENARLRKASQDFIDKVDRGEARSKDSYAAFKAALSLPNGDHQ
jgi:hypothetical protein